MSLLMNSANNGRVLEFGALFLAGVQPLAYYLGKGSRSLIFPPFFLGFVVDIFTPRGYGWSLVSFKAKHHFGALRPDRQVG
jgi:hypothetical protein